MGNKARRLNASLLIYPMRRRLLFTYSKCPFSGRIRRHSFFFFVSKLEGIQFGNNGPLVSHLFFSEDSLLFAKATESNAQAVMNILHAYWITSGQLVNFQKSFLYFSKRVNDNVRSALNGMLGVTFGEGGRKYLGLPFLTSRSKHVLFSDAKDKVREKLSRWKEKLLTEVGKEILTRSVIQAISSYAIQCFKLPKNLCDDILKMVRNFW